MAKAKAKRVAKARWRDWVLEEKKRKILSFIGGGFLAVGGAAWGAYQYFSKPDVKIEVSYKLCVAPHQSMCPAGTIFIKGITDAGRYGDTAAIYEWVNKECSQYSRKDTRIDLRALACRCTLVEVKCSTR